VAEKQPIQKDELIISKLEADLANAYQVIEQQQKHIAQLQTQLSANINQLSRHKSIVIQETSLFAENESSLLSDTRSQIKTGFANKKLSDKLSILQFTSIVAVVAVIMSFISFTLMRRTHSVPSQPTATPLAIPQQSLAPVPKLSKLPTVPNILPQIERENALAYNVKTKPNFKKSLALQALVNDIVATTLGKGLPSNPLSITLIDAKTGEYAEYQQDKPRFPASVVKLFWMVDLYAQIENGIWNESDFISYLNGMIKKSDNNAASVVLDSITDTVSGKYLKGKEYEIWLNKRKQVNTFFQQAEYEKINISQKAFPITNLKIYEPQGSDLTMRGDPKAPIRNQITTQQAARLLYEITEGQAVSAVASQKMANWLSIDSATRIEKKAQHDPNEFNPVRGYLSESLPTDVFFAGKAGWTSNSRQEAAYIATKDGKAAYILVIFAEDRSYAYDWTIFPQISRLVFERMKNI